MNETTLIRICDKLTFGSLFAGVGGFDMGFEQAGFECRFQVEWDKHCQKILNRHWPDVPKWGDVQTVNGNELPPVDVLIFGSPCQDLSVAGKRTGLDGGRSSMFYEATRIIKEMQHATGGTYPRIAVWENVPGALTSNKGADFQTVLNEMGDCGSHLIEWAVLDAQHFGVPQRRRRIFLVAVLDPAIASRCPDPLFPVREGRRGDYSKGIKKGQEIAGTLGSSLDGSSGTRDTDRMTPIPAVNFDEYNFTGGEETHHSVRAGTRQSTGVVQPTFTFTAQRVGEPPRIYNDETPTLTAHMGTGGNNTPMTLGVIPIQGTIIGRPDTAGPQGPGYGEEDSAMYTLDTVSQHGVAQPIPIQDGREMEKKQNGLGVGAEDDPSYTIDTTGAQSVAQPLIAFATNQRAEVRDIGDTSIALSAERGTNQQTYLAQPVIGFSAGNSSASYGLGITEDGTPPLRAGASGTNQVPTIAFGWQENHHAGETHTEITTALTTTKTQAICFPSTFSNGSVSNEISPTLTVGSSAGIPSPPAIQNEYAVRRLTPLECERLMGWPDDHTRWTAGGKEQSDSHRYKQCGNGVATPVAKWVAQQIRPLMKEDQ